jgi:hypothetical protein
MRNWLIFVMAATIAVQAGNLLAAPGDQWSLSGDMQVTSNPSPPIDPGPAGGGAGTWTYFHGDGNYTKATTNVPADVNSEVPDGGIGWVNPTANHLALIRFSVAANPAPPFGTGNDTTVFGVGEVGGHGTTGAAWTRDHPGIFFVEWLGYNARNQSIGPAGRMTFLRMTGPSGDLDVQPILGGPQTGLGNAYKNSTTTSLLAGETLRLVQEGGDWVGLDLIIREIPEPSSASLIVLACGLLGAWRRSAARLKCIQR